MNTTHNADDDKTDQEHVFSVSGFLTVEAESEAEARELLSEQHDIPKDCLVSGGGGA